MTDMIPPSATATELLHAARQMPARRIMRLTHQGRRYIVKSIEHHRTLLDRLQKGDPTIAFTRELALLCAFAERGAAVPRVAASDAERMILSDCGETLNVLVSKGRVTPDILVEAGRALARLHRLGLAHGRPAIRDLCWDGQRITFLDLEAGAKLRANSRDKARDAILMLNSVFAMDPAHHFAAQHLWTGYSEDTDLARSARAVARRLWWVALLAWPLAQIHRIRGKQKSEFRAVARTHAFLLQPNA